MSSINATSLSLMNSLSFAGVAEIRLGRQERKARQSVVAVARHGSRGDGEQRAAQAAAERMRLARPRDRERRLERREEALGAVIVEADVAIVRVGVLPGDHEHRESLLGEIAHEGVHGRKVEDVVFHDPGGHDHDRLGTHAIAGGRVLDDFRQARPVHHLAGRRGDGLSNHEAVVTHRRPLRLAARHVLEEMREAAHQVAAAFFPRALEHARVGGDEIRRRERVEHLPGGEGRGRRILARDAAHVGRRPLPPALDRKKCACIGVERKYVPGRIAKALVMRQRACARIHMRAEQAACGIEGDVDRAGRRFAREQQAPSGRVDAVDRPIEVGLSESPRREPRGRLRQFRPQHPVERVERRERRRPGRGGRRFDLLRPGVLLRDDGKPAHGRPLFGQFATDAGPPI
jgi:hypothetical protein